VPSLAHHYWLDERLARYGKELEWSRQLTYMALVAVEYELQQSLSLRDAALQLKLVSAEDFDRWVDAAAMTRPGSG